MIKLYKFGPIEAVCDPSPFCVKVEAYLRMVGLPYETLSGAKYLRTAPKGKLPYIENDGKIIADSELIIEYLIMTYGDKLDVGLSTVDKAIAHAFSKMVDEHLYWVVAYARWMFPHNSAALNALFFKDIPFPLNKLVALSAFRKTKLALFKQGMGRHSEAEIFEIGVQDLSALADLLGDKLFFFGVKATRLDAVVYSILSQMILVSAFTAPIFDKAKSYENLTAFTHRFHAQYFQDLKSEE